MSVTGADASRTSAPLCFMHVPKCGGQSIEASLAAVIPTGIAPHGADFGGCRIVSGLESFEDVEDWLRPLLAIREDEIEALGEYRVVAGHFMLPTLLRIAPPTRIATVLREPRARLLSLYLFFRTPRMREVWNDYCGDLLDSAAGPLDEFLHEPAIARATDNQVCRMVLGNDKRIPDDGFIAERDVATVAASTLAQLDQLGFVGILESGALMWRALSRMFGVELTPVRVNESGTPEASAGANAIPSYNETAAFDALDRRSAADRMVYEALVTRTHGSSHAARRHADNVLSGQLARFERVRAAGTSEPSRTPLAVAYDQGDA